MNNKSLESPAPTTNPAPRPHLPLANREGIHLALGGGAAKGLAHIGVLKVLQRHNLPIASIAGTSMGSMVGALYAINRDAQVVESKFLEFVHSDMYRRARKHFIEAADEARQEKNSFSFRNLLKNGLLFSRSLRTGCMIPMDDFRDCFSALLPNKTFAETSLPFFAVAAELNRKREAVFDSGLIRSAVMASCAIPGVFPPVRTHDAIYVDGSWVNKVPTAPLQAFGARHVLGIDVTEMEETNEVNSRRGFSILQRANQVAFERLEAYQAANASLMWHPPMPNLHWGDFIKVAPAVKVGIDYAEAHLGELEKLLEPPPPPLLPPPPPRYHGWWPFKKKVAPAPEPPPPPLPPPLGFDRCGIWEISRLDE